MCGKGRSSTTKTSLSNIVNRVTEKLQAPSSQQLLLSQTRLCFDILRRGHWRSSLVLLQGPRKIIEKGRGNVFRQLEGENPLQRWNIHSPQVNDQRQQVHACCSSLKHVLRSVSPLNNLLVLKIKLLSLHCRVSQPVQSLPIVLHLRLSTNLETQRPLKPRLKDPRQELKHAWQ